MAFDISQLLQALSLGSTPKVAGAVPGVAPAAIPTAPGAAGAVLNVPTGNELGAGGGTVLGIPTNQFAMLAGGLASALAPENTWQQSLGQFAQTLGKGAEFGKRIGADVEGAKLKKKQSKLGVVDTKLDLSDTLLGR